jgi:hypothetical protein
MRARNTLSVLSIAALSGALAACAGSARASAAAMPEHRNISATVFWVGEPADADNGYIANNASAWDDHWQAHFGGVDNPGKRQRGGNWPAGYRPKENPFYVALPYGDFTNSGAVKASVRKVPWYNPKRPPGSNYSILKNAWVAVTRGSKTVYVQWEDVGPANTDDAGYVFGGARPRDRASGIDLSPAAAIYLGVDGSGKVSWRFVAPSQVPSGPWRQIVTTRQVSW